MTAIITYPLMAAEALQEVRVLINESTAGFFSDEEINNWVIVGAADVALKGLGVIKQDTITLATGTMTYTAMTTAGVGGVATMLRVIAANYDTALTGLTRVNPLMLTHLESSDAGPPGYYYHLNTIFGVFPAPAAAQNTKLVTVWYSGAATDISDLPNHHQHFVLWYAASMAFHKAQKGNQANYWMTMYLNGIEAARELYDPTPDTNDMKNIQATRGNERTA